MRWKDLFATVNVLEGIKKGREHLEVIRRLKMWSEGLRAPPYSLEISPTYGCNLSCKFCNGFWNGANDPARDQLTAEDIRGVIERCQRLGVRRVGLSGDGEPLSKEGIGKVIGKIKSEHLIGSLTTNGTLIDESLAKKFVTCGWDSITFSVEAASPLHDYLVGQEGALDRVWASMRMINRFKNKFNTTKPRISTNTVVVKENLDSYPQLISRLASLRVSEVNFEHLVVDNEQVKSHKPTFKEKLKLYRHLDDLKSLAQSLNVRTNIDGLRRQAYFRRRWEGAEESEPPPELEKQVEDGNSSTGLEGAFCFVPWYQMVLRPDGSVQPCCNCYAFDNDYREGLREIWLGRSFQRLRNNIKEQRPPSFCETCNNWIIDEQQVYKKVLKGEWRSLFH